MNKSSISNDITLLFFNIAATICESTEHFARYLSIITLNIVPFKSASPTIQDMHRRTLFDVFIFFCTYGPGNKGIKLKHLFTGAGRDQFVPLFDEYLESTEFKEILDIGFVCDGSYLYIDAKYDTEESFAKIAKLTIYVKDVLGYEVPSITENLLIAAGETAVEQSQLVQEATSLVEDLPEIEHGISLVETTGKDGRNSVYYQAEQMDLLATHLLPSHARLC